MHWIYALCCPTGLLCLNGLIVSVCLFVWLFFHPFLWAHTAVVFFLCNFFLFLYFFVLHSNAPFRPQLAAARVGQPAGFWKWWRWGDGAHSDKLSDGSVLWQWWGRTRLNHSWIKLHKFPHKSSQKCEVMRRHVQDQYCYDGGKMN